MRIFVASPGDVPSERNHAREVIQNLQYDLALRGQMTFECVAWDHPGTDTAMLATMTPQAAIAEGLPRPSACDVVIGIFWARIGTPLPMDDPAWRKPDGSRYESGTEWEILDAIGASRNGGRPKVILYRCTAKFLLDDDDPEIDRKREQRARLKAFLGTFNNADGSIRGGINDYATPDEFKTRLEKHLRECAVAALNAQGGTPMLPVAPVAAPPAWPGSPFPGLRAFTPDDAPIYFGRGRETDHLVRLLDDPAKRFLLVAGASGSGKSSLVAAGLLPRLKGNSVIGAKDWVLPWTGNPSANGVRPWHGLRFTPGELDSPFSTIAARLQPLIARGDESPRALAAELESAPASIATHLTAALAGGQAWSEVLVYVDQFEEVLTTVTERHRPGFIEALLAAITTPRVRVVATIRADFYHRLLDAFPALADALRANGDVFSLAAPRSGAQMEMIAGPAARAGLALEEGLVARLVDDTGTAAGGLALLAFALHELYEAGAADRRLTIAAYEGFGGVKGAIAQRAEATLLRLPSTVQAALPEVFRELVEVDEDGVPTRRRAVADRLEHSDDARQLVDAFTKARLLVRDQERSGAATTEVAHEALLREWPRLTGWIAERKDDLRLMRQVQAAAEEWARVGYDVHHLWPHERLQPVADAMRRLGEARSAQGEPLRSFVTPEVERILAELERPETTHARRAAIGDRMDQLGDPRPGVGVQADGTPDFVWCEIPGCDPLFVRPRRKPLHQAYFMSKYLLTYAQYKAFVEARDGYADKRWWTDLKHEVAPGDQYRPSGNHPAEKVSWFDAVAYCRWATSRLGYEIRLPTEWEWVQAVTLGDASHEYAWGPEWRGEHANTSEARLSRTTAVGMYPAGGSRQGVLDLAGNVWEWCLNKTDDGDDITIGGEVPRVRRGGSWNDSSVDARASYRSVYDSDWRNLNLGVRVVCVSPIL